MPFNSVVVPGELWPKFRLWELHLVLLAIFSIILTPASVAKISGIILPRVAVAPRGRVARPMLPISSLIKPVLVFPATSFNFLVAFVPFSLAIQPRSSKPNLKLLELRPIFVVFIIKSVSKVKLFHSNNLPKLTATLLILHTYVPKP